MMNMPYRPSTPGSLGQTNDDVAGAVQQYQQHIQTKPEDRLQLWIKQNLWPKGLSADMSTGEIVDASGQVVGRLPDLS